jgi:hypothetical protein
MVKNDFRLYNLICYLIYYLFLKLLLVNFSYIVIKDVPHFV